MICKGIASYTVSKIYLRKGVQSFGQILEV